MPNGPSQTEQILKLIEDFSKLEEEMRKGEVAKAKLELKAQEIEPIIGMAEIEEEPPEETAGTVIPGVTGPTETTLGEGTSPLGKALPPADAIAAAAPPEPIPETAPIPEEGVIEDDLDVERVSVGFDSSSLLIPQRQLQKIEESEALGTAAAVSQAEGDLSKSKVLAGLNDDQAGILLEAEEDVEGIRTEFWQGAEKLVEGMEKTYTSMINNPVSRERLIAANPIKNAIGLFAGGALLPFLGFNPGLKALNTAISQDIQAQVARHEQRVDVLNAKKNQYSTFLNLLKNKEAAIHAAASAKMMSAAKKAEAEVLRSAAPDHIKAQMLREIKAATDTAIDQFNKSLQVGIQKYAVDARLAAKKGKGTGTGGKSFKKVAELFGFGASGINLEGKGGTIIAPLSGVAQSLGISPEKLKQGLDQLSVPTIKKNGQEFVDVDFIPNKWLDARDVNREQLSDEVSSTFQRIQILDAINWIVNAEPDDFTNMPFSRKKQLLKALEAAILAGEQLGVGVSDKDLEVMKNSVGAEDHAKLLELRDKNTIKKKIGVQQKNMMDKINSKLQTRLGRGISINWKLLSIEKDIHSEITGGEPGDDFTPIKSTMTKLDSLNNQVVATEDEVIDMVRELDAQSRRPGIFDPKGISLGKAGGAKGLEKRLRGFEDVATTTGNTRIVDEVKDVTNRIRRLMKGEKPEAATTELEREKLRKQRRLELLDPSERIKRTGKVGPIR